MTFHLDTTGTFHRPTGSAVYGSPSDTVITWATLPPFTQGYIEALFAASSDDLDDQWTASGDWSDAGNGPFGFSDLASATLARIIADCEAYVTQRGIANRCDGAWFWKGRQAKSVKGFPRLTVRLGNDGEVRFAEAA